MTNKELTRLIYKLLDVIIQEDCGFSVRLNENFDTNEVLEAIKSISGQDPSLESYLCFDATTSSSKTEKLSNLYQIYKEERDTIEKEDLKIFLRDERRIPSELLMDEDIDWIMNWFKKIEKSNMKKKPSGPQPQKPKAVNQEKPEKTTEKTKELIRGLYKFLQSQRCGDAVDIGTFFPGDTISEAAVEIFGKKLDLFDVYTEKEVLEDLLWDYGGEKDPESIKDFLVDEKEVSEELLNNEVLNKLFDLV